MNQVFKFLLLTVSLYACSEQKQADLIIHNATIYTVDDAFSTAEALAIKDGKIIEVGAEHQILNAYRADEVVDARQQFLYPGFIDAHSHFLGYGIERQRLDLIGTRSFEEVVQRIASYIEDHDSQWVLGRGWDQNDWETKQFPSNDTLNVLFPEHYIALKRVDGHAYLASANVLELAGIDAQTEVEGGLVVLDAHGQPTGILIDEAMSLVTSLVPEPDDAFKSKGLQIAEEDCFRVGLTSVTCAGLPVRDVQLIQRLQRNGQLKMRVHAMYSAADSLLDQMESYRIESDRLTARSIKVYADGALGSRGARLINPYTDDSSNVGLMITPYDSLVTWAEACYKAGFQLNVHCIGDQANRFTLKAMGSVLKGTNDKRWRIEHAQVVHPEDRHLFGTHNIIPSMQPTHATSDMYWAEERLGPVRIHHAYAMKSLMNENGLIALGTDFPVEDIAPIGTFYAAVTRKDPSGFPDGGFLFDEGLSREEALRGITIWAALANFDDDNRGSIEVGKFADLVLLDRDLMKSDPSNILSTKVTKTWLNGELVHE